MSGKDSTFERASAMPAATWHFLRMNDTTIEIPQGLEVAPDLQLSGAADKRVQTDEFDNMMAVAQAHWELVNPAPTAQEIAEREAYRAAEADATYGGTARSNYQAAADEMEEARSLAVAFKQGMGEQASVFLRESAGERVLVKAERKQKVDAQVVVRGAAGVVNTAAIDVVAGRGSEVELHVLVDSPDGVPAGDASVGVAGTTIRVIAADDARVRIVRTQTLDDGLIDMDDMGLLAGVRAQIDVKQTVLGSGKTFTGLAADLRGDQASLEVQTHYLGHGTQVHDFNYVVRHHGTRSQCKLDANGVLAGTSRKTLRGTIDLIRGCKGSQGRESETVLLVDEGVRNKTVPVILCNEDDVAGDHGATIGHIREEQLFYLASRGFSQESAESMFVAAALEQAAIEAPDELTQAAVLRVGERVVPGFAALFDEEA